MEKNKKNLGKRGIKDVRKRMKKVLAKKNDQNRRLYMMYFPRYMN